MYADIYIDVVFIINFLMDILVFWIAGKLARLKTTYLRLGLGSALSAALYCMLAFMPLLRGYYNFFITLAVLMLGLLAAYNPKTVKSMVLLVVYSNVSAFAIGGAAFALFYYTNLGGMIGNGLTLTFGNLPVKILLASSALSYILIKLLIHRFGNASVKKQSFYNVNIHIDRQEITLTALLDTGNSLLDPLTNEPVIIAEFSGLAQLLPDDVKALFFQHKEDELLELMNAFSKTTFISRVRIIPFTSLGRQNGMLIGFKPDSIRIANAETEYVTTKDAIVGIYNYNLSPDGSFQALLNPSIL